MRTSEATGRSRLHNVWIGVAALLVVGGAAGAAFAANSVALGDAQRSRQAFERSSGQIASTLQLAIQHEDDLIVSGAAYLAGNPDGSNAQFVQWSDSIQALKRYPELHDYGNAVVVPASKLAAFAVQAQADPWAPLGFSGTFQVEPAGDRPYYCFGTVGQVRNAEVGAPAGQDFCATGLGEALLAARDTGKSSYAPFTVGNVLALGVSTPYYRGGVVPPTVDGRRDAFLGWFGMTIVPKLVLDRALQGNPDTAIAFRYKADGSDALFRSGHAPKGAESVTIDLHNGWTVKTSGAVTAGGLLQNANALAVLIAGALLGLLLGVLVFVLGTGRARALRQVEVRTEQLRGAQASWSTRPARPAWPRSPPTCCTTWATCSTASTCRPTWWCRRCGDRSRRGWRRRSP